MIFTSSECVTQNWQQTAISVGYSLGTHQEIHINDNNKITDNYLILNDKNGAQGRI